MLKKYKSTTNSEIKAILFDLGKVLLFFNFDPAFQKLSKHTGRSTKDIEDYFVQSGLEVLYDGGKISSKRFFGQIKQSLALKLTHAQFRKIWNEIFTPNRQMIQLLKKLKKNYRVVLLSNTNEMHFTYIKNKYSFIKHFDACVLSYKEKVRKPDEAIYRIASKACRAKMSDIFYIDDRKDLTDAASELGIHAFTYQKNDSELLKRMRALGIHEI